MTHLSGTYGLQESGAIRRRAADDRERPAVEVDDLGAAPDGVVEARGDLSVVELDQRALAGPGGLGHPCLPGLVVLGGAVALIVLIGEEFSLLTLAEQVATLQRTVHTAVDQEPELSLAPGANGDVEVVFAVTQTHERVSLGVHLVREGQGAAKLRIGDHDLGPPVLDRTFHAAWHVQEPAAVLPGEASDQSELGVFHHDRDGVTLVVVEAGVVDAQVFVSFHGLEGDGTGVDHGQNLNVNGQGHQ